MKSKRGRKPANPPPEGLEIPEGHKWCGRCGTLKSCTEFNKLASAYDGLQTYCIGCQRDLRFRKAYGITLSTYNAMYTDQQGKCACCGEHKHSAGEGSCRRGTDTLVVDHDHDNGEVRALLCWECNATIGKLWEDLDVLRNARLYLRNPPARGVEFTVSHPGFKVGSPEYNTHYRLKGTFGIGWDDREFLLAKQGGTCAMCEATKSHRGGYLCVDHNHETGEVRGLLCDHCNSALGHAKDNPELLHEYTKYISYWAFKHAGYDPAPRSFASSI